MKIITKDNLESVITENDKKILLAKMLKANLYKDNSIYIEAEKKIINRYNKILDKKRKKKNIDYKKFIIYIIVIIGLIFAIKF